MFSISNSLEVCTFVQVGNAFVSQYYNVLHQSPHVVHRFYTDASHLTRAEAGADGALDTVSTQHVGTYIFSSSFYQFSFGLGFGHFVRILSLASHAKVDCALCLVVLRFILQLFVLFRWFVQHFLVP